MHIKVFILENIYCYTAYYNKVQNGDKKLKLVKFEYFNNDTLSR